MKNIGKAGEVFMEEIRKQLKIQTEMFIKFLEEITKEKTNEYVRSSRRSKRT